MRLCASNVDVFHSSLYLIVFSIDARPGNGIKDYLDGISSVSRFNTAAGVAVSRNGTLVVADIFNCVIRMGTRISDNIYNWTTIGGTLFREDGTV